MTDYLDEEMKIMDENSSNTGEILNFNINDPISNLNLNSALFANENDSLSIVISKIKNEKAGAIVILDESQNTVGIFTERDVLRRVVGNNLDLDKELVKDYMTSKPETLSEEDPIAFALNKMSDGSYRNIPITRNSKVKFMLSVKDIVDEIAFINRKNILNLPPDLKQKTSQYGG